MCRPQAREIGLTDNDLAAAVRAGALRRLDRGVYALDTVAADPHRRHVERVRGLVAARSRCAAAARSSLALAGLPLIAAALDTVILCGPGRERYHRPGAVTYPMPIDEQVIEIDGVRSVSIETAIFQTVARDGLRTAVVAADAALHRGLAGLGHDVRTQVVIRDAGGAFVGRVDALIDGMVIAEFDGAVTYAGAQGRDELIREKRREDALRSLGYVVIRVTWADLFNPERLDAMVRSALARARRLGGAPAPAAGTV